MSNIPGYPRTEVHAQNIPEELKSKPQWVVWRYEQKPGAKKPTKPPINPHTGYHCDPLKPEHWMTFHDAYNFYLGNPHIDGVGIVLENGLCGIDIDDAPHHPNEASDILNYAYEKAYIETSPSGIGGKLFGYGKTPHNGKGGPDNCLEMYTGERYFTVTGNVVSECREIVNISEVANYVYEKYFVNGRKREPKEINPQVETNLSPLPPIDDSSLWVKLTTAANSEKFICLWNGDLSMHGNDHSSADAAFCAMVYFYTDDDAQVLRFFLKSGLGQRPKANKVDYQQRTLHYAKKQTHADRAAQTQINYHALLKHNLSEPNVIANVPADNGNWPEPQPLPNDLPSVADFNPELLPGPIIPWASDIWERVQCAPDYVAVSIMCALGSLIGRKTGIRPQLKTDWTVVSNQWALLIGRPGVLKSPAIEASLAPLKRLAASAVERYQNETTEFEKSAKIQKMKAEIREREVKAKLSKDLNAPVDHLFETAECEEPVLHRYITNDSTAAALGELHRLNPNGLLVHRDEIASLLKNLDREDNAEARGFYLTGWNGDSGYTFDRIGRGLNLHIPAVCLSILGSTQPGRIADYIRSAVRGGAGDDGLIQRFGLLVWPDNQGEWRDVDRWPDTKAREEANLVFEYLDTFSVDDIQAEVPRYSNESIPFLRFDSAGHGLFLEWRTELESRLRSGDLHPAMESHLAKHRKLVPALAMIIHLVERGSGPVGREATRKALAWAEYLETHAVRAYGSISMPEVSAARAIISRIRKGDLPREFAGWQVLRPCWAMLTDRVKVNDALQLLVDLNWLRSFEKKTNGRPATVYQASPWIS